LQDGVIAVTAGDRRLAHGGRATAAKTIKVALEHKGTDHDDQPACRPRRRTPPLTLDELEAIAGAKDNSWVVDLFGRVFFGKVDDGEGPSFGFACVKPGKTTYCVVL
jgi:hypothetical protein